MSSGDMFPRDFIRLFEQEKAMGKLPAGYYVKDGRVFTQSIRSGEPDLDVCAWPLETAAGLTTDKAVRKDAPMATGVLDYFPDALFAVAQLSKIGNEQHNPGQPLHWAKEKSTDHADCVMRHLAERGTIDDDGVRHSTKVAWRALANLQIEIEKERS